MKPTVTFHCTICNQEVWAASYVCIECRAKARDKIARDETRTELYVEIERLKNALELAEEQAKYFENKYKELSVTKIGDKFND